MTISSHVPACLCLLGFLISAPVLAEDVPTSPPRPNVLFIAIDDMRDWTGYTGSTVAKTPNLDRLAASGMAFTRAYTAFALCNPSRTALLTGLRPSTTGVTGNGIDWREAVPVDRPTLIGTFHAQGYRTLGQGKIFHGGRLRREDWDLYAKDKNGKQGEDREGDKRDYALRPGDTEGAFTIGSSVVTPLDGPEDGLVDYQTAGFGVAELGKAHGRPFFLACGFHRPHLPWSVPRKYFDMFPLESIPPPDVTDDDLADLPAEGVTMAGAGEFAAVQDLGKYRECVRGYLASIAFTDTQVGRLLDALDASPYRDTTIVVLWSDHGWHHGEKEHWRKSTLWEEATRSPLIWRVPGVTKPGTVCARPIDFLGIYPTLCELAGLPLPPHLEGVSVKPLLADPSAAWDRPAISTMHDGNHAVRTDRWRYIRYAGGGEELYDEVADPHEWTNLAGDDRHAAVKADLARWLPKDTAPARPKGKAKPGKSARTPVP